MLTTESWLEEAPALFFAGLMAVTLVATEALSRDHLKVAAGLPLGSG
jgi:hypothetical protein